jgi:hypothetical protein
MLAWIREMMASSSIGEPVADSWVAPPGAEEPMAPAAEGTAPDAFRLDVVTSEWEASG